MATTLHMSSATVGAVATACMVGKVVGALVGSELTTATSGGGDP
jgi:hypothetical protein